MMDLGESPKKPLPAHYMLLISTAKVECWTRKARTQSEAGSEDAKAGENIQVASEPSKPGISPWSLRLQLCDLGQVTSPLQPTAACLAQLK